MAVIFMASLDNALTTTTNHKIKMAAPNRFLCDISDNDVDDFINGQKNKNTTRKTASDVRLFQTFLLQQGKSNIIERLETNELNNLLSKFLLTVRKKDGTEYEPQTLKSYLSSLNRYLKDRHYGVDIQEDPAFAKVRSTLKAKQRQLKSMGKGNRPNASGPLSDAEIEQMWLNGTLGGHSPNSILNTLWLYNSLGFILRGSQEHRAMCWGDVQLGKDEDGTEYLTFNERQTKTRQGDTTDIRAVPPTLWANEDDEDRCPIKIYKLYRDKRPADFNGDDDPFYLAATTRFNGQGSWFMRQPVGQNKLGLMMRQMTGTLSRHPQERKLTNHSGRKTIIQKYTDKDIPPTDIVQMSGHKNVNSVISYAKLNRSKQKRISSNIYPDRPKKFKSENDDDNNDIPNFNLGWTSIVGSRKTSTITRPTSRPTTTTAATTNTARSTSTTSTTPTTTPTATIQSTPPTMDTSSSQISRNANNDSSSNTRSNTSNSCPTFNFNVNSSMAATVDPTQFAQNLFNGFISGSNNNVHVQININFNNQH